MKDLNQLLKQWKDIEPASNFDAQVWRQIKIETTRRGVRPVTLADWLRVWLPQPALVLTVAVMLGLIIGTWSGTASVPAHVEQLRFLGRDTLAGLLQR